MVRSTDGSTIISYHPSPEGGTTSARKLHSRIHLAGKSVYWTKIFQRSTDPTFILLTMLWHACYSWDEALSALYEHITDLESTVIETGENAELTRRTRGGVIRRRRISFADIDDVQVCTGFEHICCTTLLSCKISKSRSSS